MNAASILAQKQKGREVVTAAPETALTDAARMLDEHKIGALVITGAGGELRGVVSERDIARAIARHGAAALDQSVDHIMTSKVVTAAPNDTIDVMMGCMTERRIRHLPVLEQGRLVGLVSIGDIVKAKIEAAEAENEAIKTYITSGV